VELKDSEYLYTARVDLAEGKVVDLTKMSLGAISNEPPDIDIITYAVPDSDTSFDPGEADR
jgi:hypothetical protein